MNTMKVFVLLSVLTIAASGFCQGQQKRPEPGSISPDATSDCQSTFTSGSGQTYFQFCVTVNGNVRGAQRGIYASSGSAMGITVAATGTVTSTGTAATDFAI